MLEEIHEEQIRWVTVTNARLWRQGQTAETVVIHHIVAENTMGEAMMTALKRKDRTQDADAGSEGRDGEGDDSMRQLMKEEDK